MASFVRFHVGHGSTISADPNSVATAKTNQKTTRTTNPTKKTKIEREREREEYKTVRIDCGGKEKRR